MLEKACVECGRIKDLSLFYRSKGYVGGIMTRCKECHNKRTKQYRLANPELYKSYKEKYQEDRRYVKKDNERARIRRRLNPQKNQEYKRIHRALKYGSGGRHSQEQWEQLLLVCGNKCLCCGVSGLDSVLTRDHIIPLSLGGSDDISNIQPLCQNCNSKKGNRRATDYRNGTELLVVVEKTVKNLVCPYCQIEFKTSNARTKFCSKECKIKFHNKAHK